MSQVRMDNASPPPHSGPDLQMSATMSNAKASGAGTSRGNVEARIRKRIIQAIFEQRFPPGAKVTEDQLASTFDVSRTVIRQVMSNLAQDGLIVKLPNVGSTIAAPSRKEAADILAVRRMVEPEIVRTVAANLTRPGSARLERHLAQEDEMRRKGDRGTLVRLTGEFHLLLAELAGNKILLRLMTELQALTCLAILLYAEASEACPPDEHRSIVTAIRDGNDVEAVRAMLEHLAHVEADLRLDRFEGKADISETIAWLKETRLSADALP